ncbi:type II toxin-antitoxin system VapC family toxin [Achromobacter ruhlandii]|uniref:Type II toxin-antitoxin system VapC family toxin n=1 Tax=Achromobacter ruhlandii TaxID=72557 RepID=A0A848NH74_9BURK|nr:type II toxin-antitoxin system VapC family toxin [Achromobacter ruhlandii]
MGWTPTISALLRDPNGPAARHIERVGPKVIFTSAVVATELRYGCAKKGAAKLQGQVENLLGALPVLPLDVPVDIKYGSLRTELEAAGEPIGANELWIGAHACTLGLTLVTGDTREFERIPGLAVENWLA